MSEFKVNAVLYTAKPLKRNPKDDNSNAEAEYPIMICVQYRNKKKYFRVRTETLTAKKTQWDYEKRLLKQQQGSDWIFKNKSIRHAIDQIKDRISYFTLQIGQTEIDILKQLRWPL